MKNETFQWLVILLIMLVLLELQTENGFSWYLCLATVILIGVSIIINDIVDWLERKVK